jgi:hypothetical protein
MTHERQSDGKSRFSAMGAAGRAAQPENLRRHSVDLERVQRLHLGVDDEPMEFSADTIAAMLQEIADVCDPASAFELHAVVRALEGKDAHHRLELKQVRRGKFASPAEHFRRNMDWLNALAALEEQGVKTEAAIATIAEQAKCSRASVFAGIKEAEEICEVMRAADPSAGTVNRRPAKRRNS